MSNRFEAEFSKSLEKTRRENDYFTWRRFYDTKTFRQVSEKIVCIKQPGDFFAIYRGQYFLFELKSSKNKVSFSTRFIKDHQLKSLREFKRCGAKSYLIICNRSKRMNFRAFALSTFNFDRMLNFLKREGRKSIRWHELEDFSIELSRLPNSLWDLEELLNIRSTNLF